MSSHLRRIFNGEVPMSANSQHTAKAIRAYFLCVALLSGPSLSFANEDIFGLCMSRAQAIESTAEVRDSGVSQHDYEVRYSQAVGRPLLPIENEVMVLAYATPQYTPLQLQQIAINGCQQFLR